ncbi:MAG: hypothetical protein L0207_04950 [Chlamydiae bacterium]|nr:hypothetical protein [Chlamydiota bacterium]
MSATIYIPNNAEEEQLYISELKNAFENYVPPMNGIILEDGKLKVVMQTEAIYKKFLTERQVRQKAISERILYILELSPAALHSIKKDTYFVFYTKIQDLISEWDPAYKSAQTVKSQSVLNLVSAMNFFQQRMGTNPLVGE